MGTLYTPADPEIQSAASSIRAQSPTLGLTKLLAQIKSQNPTWSLSEKASPRSRPFSPYSALKNSLPDQQATRRLQQRLPGLCPGWKFPRT